VGSYFPNKLGLFDMHGNVWEWCVDELKDDKGDPQRVHRGGAWHNGREIRALSRSHRYPPSFQSIHLGLRLARVPVGKDITKEKPPAKKADFTNSLGMEFVKVPKGTGWLGGGNGKQGETKVVIEQDFYLGKYEVTQEEWEKVMGVNPSVFKRENDVVKGIPDAELKRFPVENVSWDDCQLFIKKLNEREKDSGWVYRLPKESEWEYACRGGPVDKLDSAFDYYFAKPTNTLLPDQANFATQTDKALKLTCKVGLYEANRLGLHDLHGNVREWCDDPATGADGASYRVYRGSCWLSRGGVCRAAYRSSSPPSYRYYALGLRLARVPSAPSGK